MRDGSRKRSPGVDHPRSTPPSTATAKAPHAKSLPAFTGAARHLPPAGDDESLAIGYLFLLQRLLECLRCRTDQGYADAARLIADFQRANPNFPALETPARCAQDFF
jgi:hypothetical protein